MARVRLFREEVDDLPPVCWQCGAPATVVLEKTFAWHPPWIDWLIILGLIFFAPLLILGVVLAAVQTKRMHVAVPFCDAHRNHWRWRAWFIYGGLAAVAVLGVGALAFFFAVPPGNPDTPPVAGWTCAGAALVGLIWLVAAALVQRGAISPVEITEDDISVIRVSPAFREALERQRDEEDAADEAERRARAPKRRRGAEGIYDPDAQGYEQPPPDAYRAGDE